MKLYLLSVGGGEGDTVYMIPVSSNHRPGNKRETPEDTKTLQYYPLRTAVRVLGCRLSQMEEKT